MPPGADGLFFSPHLGGRICPADPARRGAWTGFSWGHTRAHFFRSILESVGLRIRLLSRGAREPGARASSASRRAWSAAARGAPAGTRSRRTFSASPTGRLPRADLATWGSAIVAGSRRRTDPRYGGGGSARLGSRTEPRDHARARRRIAAYRSIVSDYIEWQKEIGPDMSARPERHPHLPRSAPAAPAASMPTPSRGTSRARSSPRWSTASAETAASAVADFGIEQSFADVERRARLGRVRCGRDHHADLHASRLRGRGGKGRQARLRREADGADARRMRRHHRRREESRRRRCRSASCAGSIRISAPAYERIKAGEIGRPMIVKSLTHGPGLPPPWARDMKLSNGMLAEVNSHDWDCVRWLAGLEPGAGLRRDRQLQGRSTAASTIPPSTTPPSSRSASTTDRSARSPASARATTATTRGSRSSAKRASCRSARCKGRALVVGIDRDKGLVTPIHRTWPERFAWGYIREMEHFIDCIRHGRSRRRAESTAAGRWPACSPARSRSRRSGRCGWPRS